ncbi:nucleotidyltransferase family protein [Nocardia crassostreae]|uniref:nucleotidyltransferase family protein n=1 Tax=Nocardia crassostreae TaxID=53428 RepID=UPI00082C70B0|nr:NTP transferase domain-containing protein [Nocardia crassostreae]
MTLARCDGIVLAAGAGTRYGMPKALAENGAWLQSAIGALRDGGCDRVIVVLGATGPARCAPGPGGDCSWLVSLTPRIALPPGVRAVWAADWAVGLSASLRAGIAAAAAAPGLGLDLAARTTAGGTVAAGITSDGNATGGNTGGPPEFVAIMPVDTPDVGGDAVARVIAAAYESASGLARAVFRGTPGHPVVLGRAHWSGAVGNAERNSGAGTYLKQRADMVCVTCDDLATGIDRDYPRDSTR